MSDICTIEDPRSQFVSVSGVTFTFYRVGELCRLTCHNHEGTLLHDFPEEFLKLFRIMIPTNTTNFQDLSRMNEDLAAQLWHMMDSSRDFQLTWRKGQDGLIELEEPGEHYTCFNWQAAAAV